jgi:hypothetical protein
MSRSDPIRKSHYDAVSTADTVSDWLFYIAAALSLVFPFVEKAAHPVAFDWVQYLFVLAVVLLFGIGLASRLYLVPRAEEMRRKDFFSNAMGVHLTHQRTDGYYNNNLTDPSRRMAAQVLENSHFSKAILLRMLRVERTTTIVYLAIWLLFVINRSTDLGWIVAATQAVFGEQLLSKWVRMEWLRVQCEETYGKVFSLFQAGASASHFSATAMEAITAYESAKANAGIVLSSKVFNKLNNELSTEWDIIKATLHISPSEVSN